MKLPQGKKTPGCEVFARYAFIRIRCYEPREVDKRESGVAQLQAYIRAKSDSGLVQPIGGIDLQAGVTT
jgi:hypothetical protein